MTRTYHPAKLPDGSDNPKHKKRIYQTAKLADGSDNLKYRPDTRTRPGDRHKGKHASGAHRGRDTFIAIDGEGVEINGHHEYVLLAASTGEYIVNRRGLTTTQCFEFLLELARKYPHAIFVGFGTSYDVNMWLRDLEKRALEKLWQGRDSKNRYPLAIAGKQHDYHLGYWPRKRFCLGEIIGYHLNKNKGKAEPVYNSITLYDAFSFFQKSFTETLETWFPEYLHDGVITFPDGLEVSLDRIKAMKRARSTFTLKQLETEVLPYCLDETRVLVKLMERLRDYLAEVGVTLSSWHGAGAIAHAMMTREGVKDHVNTTPGIRASLDKDSYNACLRAYAGGRMELRGFGTYIGDVYNYDVHSAFPSIMPDLQSFKDGMWRLVRGMSNKPYSIMHVRWQFDDRLPYYPFFFRDDQDSIYFPPAGEGWYHRSEVDTALRAYAQGKLSTERDEGKIEVVESWEFVPYTGIKPFAFVTDLYEQRRRWKAEKPYNPAEKVLKLALNSFYGKTIQSVSGTEENPPTFHNIFWAGFLTAGIRAKMFDAMMQEPLSIIMVTTDGIYSTKPLALDLGEGLGEWELNTVDGVVAVQAGVYWGLKQLDHEPKPADEQRYWQHEGVWYRLNAHYKGYDRGSLTLPAVMAGWEKHLRSLTIPSPARFVTLGSALALDDPNELWEAWCSWRVIERKLELYPVGKRVCSSVELDEMQRGKRPTPNARMLTTYACFPLRTCGRMSYPYRLDWMRDESEEPNSKLDGIDAYEVEAEMYENEVM